MRLIKRTLIVLLGSVLALVLFLVGSVLVDAVIGRGRLDALVNTTIDGPGGAPVRAYVAQPAGAGPFPAVIMIHEFWGMRSEIAGKAAALAQQGYVVVAPDTYRGQTTNWIPRAIYLALSTADEQVNSDLDAVFAWLSSQPNVDPKRIVVMGFCYGGGKALVYSLHNDKLAATGIFYGSLISEPSRLKTLPGPVLGIFGEQDQAPSPANVAAFETGLTAAGIPHQLTIYPGVGHAFVKDMGTIRQGGVPGQAWDEFVTWLGTVTK